MEVLKQVAWIISGVAIGTTGLMFGVLSAGDNPALAVLATLTLGAAGVVMAEHGIRGGR